MNTRVNTSLQSSFSMVKDRREGREGGANPMGVFTVVVKAHNQLPAPTTYNIVFHFVKLRISFFRVYVPIICACNRQKLLSTKMKSPRREPIVSI